MPDNDEREQQILDAAVAVIVRLGYDKTTMSDIAEEAGVSRGTVYLYFKGKEELFDALIFREWMLYAQTLLEHVEADPRGGTVGGFYRALFQTMNSRPLIASLMRRDRRIIGNYLRKPNHLFTWIQSGMSSAGFLQMLQTAGAVRQDVDPVVMGHIIDLLSYGQLTIEEFKPLSAIPPNEVLYEAIADMMDRLFAPEDDSNREAGKAVIRQIVAVGREQLEIAKQAKQSEEARES